MIHSPILQFIYFHFNFVLNHISSTLHNILLSSGTDAGDYCLGLVGDCCVGFLSGTVVWDCLMGTVVKGVVDDCYWRLLSGLLLEAVVGVVVVGDCC